MKLLINYANSKYRASQRQNSRTGLAIARFDKVISYSGRDIDTNFRSAHAAILRHKIGNGYWLWKPYFIRRSLSLLEDGDFLFYCDAGATFIDAIDPLIAVCERQDQDVIAFELQYLESAWTKRDAFVLMDCDAESFGRTRQRLASFMLIRKSKFALQFADDYLRYASDARIVTDQDNVLGERNHDDFIAHRHDQSVFSLLTKKHGLAAFRDPSQWGNAGAAEYPTSTYGQIIDHTRKRTNPILRRLWYSLDRPSGASAARNIYPKNNAQNERQAEC